MIEQDAMGNVYTDGADAFTVTDDLIDTGQVGASWPNGPRGSAVIGRDTPGAERWHVRDDDGEHYYSGWLIGDMTWEVVLDWAAGYAGATAVFDGQWRMVIG